MRNSHRITWRALLVATLAVGSLAAPGLARSAPPNDDRADAAVVQPPQTVQGTLVGATVESANDTSYCGNSTDSVWYRFTAPQRGAIIQLDAAGDLDATIDLLRKTRSRLQPVTCAVTDAQGLATIDYDGLDPGATYVIRVAKEFGSVADSFTLRVLIPSAPATPPGKHLPDGGVSGTVDRLADQGDAFWSHLSAGRSMRVYLREDGCTSVSLYAPGTKSFSSEPVKRLKCGGYSLFTPDQTGRYILLVEAGKSRDVQRYRLRVESARADDTTPGVFVRNHAHVKAKVNGGIDSVDLYRFDVTRRSELTLKVSGGPTVQLRRNGGRYLGSGATVEQVVHAGRYYAAVSGKGHYTFSRVSRAVTHATVTFAGARKARMAPGGTIDIRLAVHPAVAGQGVITLERNDPVAGWQFLQRRSVRVVNGRAVVTVRPPSVGQYRARGEFLTGRDAAGSYAEAAKLLVRSPLEE